MKRYFVFCFLLFIASQIFAQNHTFQGLPWGATKEQIIAKLGKPSYTVLEDELVYHDIILYGYKSFLRVYTPFDCAVFEINQKELNSDMRAIALNMIYKKLVEKYESPSKKKNYTDLNNSVPYFALWHLNDFHVLLMLEESKIYIAYFSDLFRENLPDFYAIFESYDSKDLEL